MPLRRPYPPVVQTLRLGFAAALVPFLAGAAMADDWHKYARPTCVQSIYLPGSVRVGFQQTPTEPYIQALVKKKNSDQAARYIPYQPAPNLIGTQFGILKDPFKSELVAKDADPTIVVDVPLEPKDVARLAIDVRKDYTPPAQANLAGEAFDITSDIIINKTGISTITDYAVRLMRAAIKLIDAGDEIPGQLTVSNLGNVPVRVDPTNLHLQIHDNPRLKVLVGLITDTSGSVPRNWLLHQSYVESDYTGGRKYVIVFKTCRIPLQTL